MTYHALTAGWTARILTETAPADLDQELRAGIPATVPGVVHTDLLTAGLITDPFVDDAESTLQWIGRSDWEYRTTFDWSDDGSVRHDLVAAGLDTVAHIELNGSAVAAPATKHVSNRFDVSAPLTPGTNNP